MKYTCQRCLKEFTQIPHTIIYDFNKTYNIR